MIFLISIHKILYPDSLCTFLTNWAKLYTESKCALSQIVHWVKLYTESNCTLSQIVRWVNPFRLFFFKWDYMYVGKEYDKIYIKYFIIILCFIPMVKSLLSFIWFQGFDEREKNINFCNISIIHITFIITVHFTIRYVNFLNLIASSCSGFILKF